MISLIKSWASLKIDHVGSKTRSLGQMLEKLCVHSRGHIFNLDQSKSLSFGKELKRRMDDIDEYKNLLPGKS